MGKSLIGYHVRVSAEDDVKELIETNFKLLAMSLREASVRSGEMETNLGDVKDLAEFNKTSFQDMATRLDQTLEAIKVLAFGGAESKKEILNLRQEVQDLQERLKIVRGQTDRRGLAAQPETLGDHDLAPVFHDLIPHLLALLPRIHPHL